MARYIHCEDCKNRIALSAKGFGELYEYVEGIALKGMSCDGACGTDEAKPINKGDKCFAAVLLPNRSHPNYEKQKPEAWAMEFIKVKQEDNDQSAADDYLDYLDSRY